MICVSLNCVVRTDPIETVSASSTYMQTQHTTPHHNTKHDTGIHTSSSQMHLHLNLSSYMRVHGNVSTAAAASVYE